MQASARSYCDSEQSETRKYFTVVAFKLSLEYSNRKVQENQDGFGTEWDTSVSGANVNLLCENTNPTKRSTETFQMVGGGWFRSY